MQSVAFARPSLPATLRGSRRSWRSTLRRIGELGRLALTTLVLAVGLGGVAALGAGAPAVAAAPAHPVVVASRVDSLGPDAPAGPRAGSAAPQARPVVGDARRPVPAPAGGPVTAAPADRPAVDPTGGGVVRRGPPRR
ncbi:hypothetical protein [Micromonospora carbonacea]|uniref:Uncharacterized protein n=1 Tax=Micromonospora carbonacea TaxID=47853 RepID=A0A1C4YN98_9ACTN|nr:hypothetical protein [Micromonospora carbonacea]SCF22154.1 hypothetical protein GA0070563_106287 [Micromonospora carbonacea]